MVLLTESGDILTTEAGEAIEIEALKKKPLRDITDDEYCAVFKSLYGEEATKLMELAGDHKLLWPVFVAEVRKIAEQPHNSKYTDALAAVLNKIDDIFGNELLSEEAGTEKVYNKALPTLVIASIKVQAKILADSAATVNDFLNAVDDIFQTALGDLPIVEKHPTIVQGDFLEELMATTPPDTTPDSASGREVAAVAAALIDYGDYHLPTSNFYLMGQIMNALSKTGREMVHIGDLNGYKIMLDTKGKALSLNAQRTFRLAVIKMVETQSPHVVIDLSEARERRQSTDTTYRQGINIMEDFRDGALDASSIWIHFMKNPKSKKKGDVPSGGQLARWDYIGEGDRGAVAVHFAQWAFSPKHRPIAKSAIGAHLKHNPTTPAIGEAISRHLAMNGKKDIPLRTLAEALGLSLDNKERFRERVIMPILNGLEVYYRDRTYILTPNGVDTNTEPGETLSETVSDDDVKNWRRRWGGVNWINSQLLKCKIQQIRLPKKQTKKQAPGGVGEVKTGEPKAVSL